MVRIVSVEDIRKLVFKLYFESKALEDMKITLMLLWNENPKSWKTLIKKYDFKAEIMIIYHLEKFLVSIVAPKINPSRYIAKWWKYKKEVVKHNLNSFLKRTRIIGWSVSFIFTKSLTFGSQCFWILLFVGK